MSAVIVGFGSVHRSDPSVAKTRVRAVVPTVSEKTIRAPSGETTIRRSTVSPSWIAGSCMVGAVKSEPRRAPPSGRHSVIVTCPIEVSVQ